MGAFHAGCKTLRNPIPDIGITAGSNNNGAGRVMPGFVDEVSQQFVRGWHVDDDRRAGPRAVLVSINGEARYCALCQEPRPDVVEAGITTRSDVGFLAPIPLQPGDLVRVSALDSGRLLNDGLAVVMADDAADGFIDVESGMSHPVLGPWLAPLRPHLDVRAFRPLPGQTGQFSGLEVRTADVRYIVHCQLPRAYALGLERLYRQVLAPGGIAAPSLKAVIDHGETASLVVERIEGQPLVAYREGRETVFRDTMDSLEWLAQIGRPDGWSDRDLGRRGRRALNRMITDVCLAALKRRRWQELERLLKMALVVYRLPRVFSHGDLHPQNVLIQESTGAPIFIDWDHAGMLPVGCDLARLLLSVPPRLAEAWIEEAQGREGAPRRDAMRLGWLVMTYFALSRRHPDFHATEESRYLHRRYAESRCRKRPGFGAISQGQ